MGRKKQEAPLLGLATTRELLGEVACRMEITQNSLAGCELGVRCRNAIANLAGGVLDYRTVDPDPDLLNALWEDDPVDGPAWAAVGSTGLARDGASWALTEEELDALVALLADVGGESHVTENSTFALAASAVDKLIEGEVEAPVSIWVSPGASGYPPGVDLPPEGLTGAENGTEDETWCLVNRGELELLRQWAAFGVDTLCQ